MNKADILQEFEIFFVPTGGIGEWLTSDTHEDVFTRLSEIDNEALTIVQLNQLLALSHEAPLGEGFFNYYWRLIPERHPYSVSDLPGFSSDWLRAADIVSLAHLKWGLYRLYVDALLYFGNVRTAFRGLRNLSYDELEGFFSLRRFDTDSMRRRGPSLPLKSIAKDDRYLISEMACKSYGELTSDQGDVAAQGDLQAALERAYEAYVAANRPAPTIRELLEQPLPPDAATRQGEFIFSADEILDKKVVSMKDLKSKYRRVARKFSTARRAALDNTHYYLSMVNDLDVYVATSMRTRDHFRKMATTCETMFGDRRFLTMNLRYFDPTLSAAGGHEDKGLIECLMVKCAKVLVYCAGDKESYGKDAEAAMALSLGKPVIFYCDSGERGRFYRDVHPLDRDRYWCCGGCHGDRQAERGIGVDTSDL